MNNDIDELREEILKLHTPYDADSYAEWKGLIYYKKWGVELTCTECEHDYPCKTVRLVSDASAQDFAVKWVMDNRQRLKKIDAAFKGMGA